MYTKEKIIMQIIASDWWRLSMTDRLIFLIVFFGFFFRLCSKLKYVQKELSNIKGQLSVTDVPQQKSLFVFMDICFFFLHRGCMTSIENENQNH